MNASLEQMLKVPTPPRNAENHKLVSIFFFILAFGLGAIQAWASRHSMNPDGVCYLDIADAYLRRDWAGAINAYWSPLYSWLLAAALFILRPTPYWEFSVAHLVNFLVYLGSFLSFTFFLDKLICSDPSPYTSSQRGEERVRAESEPVHLPQWALLSLGYTLYLWSSLGLISLTTVAPDLALAAIVYLASGLLLRIRKYPASWSAYVFFGVVLGLGYLTRAFMFPLAFIFFGVGFFAVGNFWKPLPRMLVAFAVFLLIVAPYVLVLSQAKGRLTISDQPRVKYLAWLNGTGVQTHEQLEAAPHRKAEHPTRKIFEHPAIYEFGTPVGGTYPFHYDASYWNEGLTPRFNLERLLSVLRSGVKTYYVLFFRLLSGFLVGLLTLFYLGGKHSFGREGILKQWVLIIPAAAPLAMFLPFRVEERVLGSFVVILGMAFVSSIRLPEFREVRQVMNGITFAILVVMVVQLGALVDRESYETARNFIFGEGRIAHSQWQVAESLHRLGIQPGDKVASIGTSYHHYWARLARVQIVAEIPSYYGDHEYFWAADPQVKLGVINAFEKSGAKAIIVQDIPGWASSREWKRLGETNYYAYIL